MRHNEHRIINLALQGGGAHGAFTWGVLDRLLEDERLVIEGVSGTSSGAMNATALACGLTFAGREGARRLLTEFWTRIGVEVPRLASLAEPFGAERAVAAEGMLAVARTVSPYQFNPLNFDPLRGIVTELFDFERLRAQSALKLYIAATQVRTGKLRLFEAHELTPDMLMASACLPSFRQAVEIEGEAYWDGGYAGNPALSPLFHGCESQDLVAVLLQPLNRPDLPTTTKKIRERTSELSFSTAFLREMRTIVQAKQQSTGKFPTLSRLERRLRRFNVHLIEPDQLIAELDGASKLDNRHGFLTTLRDRGRAQADVWLNDHFDCLGRRSSIDLAQFC